MFTKKFLLLLLAAGLAFGFSLNAFAVNEQCEFNGSTVNIAKNDTEIVKEFHNMLAIPASAKFFVINIYRNIILPGVIICEFCDKLITYIELVSSSTAASSYMNDVCLDTLKMELSAKFEYLCNNDEDFKEAFNNAWIKKANNENSHASIQGGINSNSNRIKKCLGFGSNVSYG